MIRNSNAPDKVGVYLFLEDPFVMPLFIRYIGKSGTINSDGTWKKQTIRKRLMMKQDGMKRRKIIPELMKQRNLDKIYIKCFVTYDKEMSLEDLPGYVEGLLLNEILKELTVLPVWNRAY